MEPGFSDAAKTMPFRVLTNDPYERSLQFLKQHAGFGGELAVPGGTGSLQRFVRASSALQQFSKTDPISFAFKTLQEVAQPRQTQWSIVYDLTNRKIHFRTLDNPEIRTVRLNGFDFSCASPVRVFDLDQPGTRDVTNSFVSYDREMNKELIRKSYQGTPFLANAPESEIDSTAKHPEAFFCTK